MNKNILPGLKTNPTEFIIRTRKGISIMNIRRKSVFFSILLLIVINVLFGSVISVQAAETTDKTTAISISEKCKISLTNYEYSYTGKSIKPLPQLTYLGKNL
ncbi:MAG: hypothetical protein Q4C42_04645 [Clostridia bacterium]|nr:hypothetical protein [Clostridia bacterium]